MLTILLLQSTLLANPVSEGSTEPSDPAAEATLDLDILDTPDQEVEEGSAWSGMASVSLTDVSGNSTSSNSAVNFGLTWEGDLDALAFGAQYAGVRTTDKATGDASTTSRLYQYDAGYDRFFSTEKNLFGYANVGTRQDEPNGLQMRASTGAGMGYRFHVLEEGKVDVEGGVSYVAENKIGTLNDTSAVGRAAFDFHSGAVKEDFIFFATGEFLKGGDIESYVQEIGMGWKLNETWSLDVTNNIAWDGNPSAGFTSTDRRWNLLLSTTF